MRMHLRSLVALAAIAASGLFASAAMAADPAVPTPAPPTAPGTEAAPLDAKAPLPNKAESPAQPTPKNAPETPKAPAPVDAQKALADGDIPPFPIGSVNPDQREKPDARPESRPRNQAGDSRQQAPSPNDRGNRPAAGAQGRANIGLSFGSPTNGGLVVSSIGAGGAFANLGLQQGDQIVASGNRQFNNQADFYGWLGTARPGQRVPLVITRGGQQQTLYWTPTEQFVQQFASAPVAAPAAFLGIVFDNENQEAAVVADVQPNSPAQRSGIRAGDVIVGVNDHLVSNANEFVDLTAQLSPGQPIDLAVSRIMNVRIASTGSQVQTGQQQVVPATPATPPAVAPAPVRQYPVTPAPSYRRGVFRRR